MCLLIRVPTTQTGGVQTLRGHTEQEEAEQHTLLLKVSVTFCEQVLRGTSIETCVPSNTLCHSLDLFQIADPETCYDDTSGLPGCRNALQQPNDP